MSPVLSATLKQLSDTLTTSLKLVGVSFGHHNLLEQGQILQ